MAIELYEYKREFNKLLQTKTKIRLIGADIFFLKNCMKHKVTPKFARLVNKNKTYNKNFSKAKEYANYKFLKLEIINHYRNRSSLEIQAYNLHLNLAKNIHIAQWDILQDKLYTVVEHKYEVKKFNQNKKFEALIKEKEKTNKDDKIINTKEWENDLV
jgi:CRISPR/Cas system-associated endonuclease/helicase Cas3